MSSRQAQARIRFSSGVLAVSAWLMSGLSFAGMHSTTHADAPTERVRVVNHLSQCLAVEQKHVKTVGPITVLEVHVKAKSSVASCGCMSSLLAYRTNETFLIDGKPEEYERSFGLVAAPMHAK